MTPVLLDLCCGLGGWTRGFQAVGYECHGYDVKDWGYPGTLHLYDIRDTQPIIDMWRSKVDVIVASPPCTEFTVRDLPWSRNKGLPPPDLSIVQACFAIREGIQPRVFVLENVRGAQPYIGRAPVHRKSYYFWGDTALIPHLPQGHFKGVPFESWRANGNRVINVPNKSKESISGTHPEMRALIPWPLAYGLACLCYSGLRGGE